MHQNYQQKKLNNNFDIGVWRSWLARPAGGGEAAGSSPATPTIVNLSYHKILFLSILHKKTSGKE